jgi:ATP-dependent protease ClpP protease subunit
MTQANTQTPTPGKWYSIRNRTAVAAAALGALAATSEIFIYGDIGESWYGDTITAAQFVKDIAEINAQAITVRINSFGGSVTDGIAIHNAMKRHPANITVCVDGIAASIASLIAMAGDSVEMAENSMLMIHAPWTVAGGNSADLRATADMLDSWSTAMATSYASKSGQTADAMLALLTDGADHWYTAADALAAGFANSVVSAAPEAASAMASFNLQTRYRTAPASLVQRIPVAAATPTQENFMPQSTNPQAAATQSAIDIAAIQAAAVAGESARRSDISAKFAKFAGRDGVQALQAACESDTTVSPQAAGDRLLAHLGAQSTPIAGLIVTVKDETDKRLDAMAQSVLARASVVTKDGPVRADGTNPYRGAKLLDLARASLQATGHNTMGMDQRAVVAAAFTQSSSDFPVLLENIMHKTLQSAYALQADTWTRFCARGTVSDFRVHRRYRVGSLGNLDAKTELGEYRNKAIPDGEKASITASSKGNIVNISRETIINDDLGALTSVTSAMGRAAKRTVEADVYATLALNSGFGPTLDDGITLFHASHNNVSTGAPLVASFDAARVIMASQKDVSNNDYLTLMPAVWLGPIGLGGAARVVLNSTYDPDTANKLQRANIAAGMVQDIVDTPRLSGLPWFFFANPLEAPVLEVAFLDGNDTPYLELENGFSVDGSSWKVRMDYGVAGVDFRGAVRSTGA